MENDRLFDLRDYNNLTQKAVGELLGVRQQSYGEWEKGKKTFGNNPFRLSY